MSGEHLKTYSVWDAPTRWFHWITFVCVVALAALGFLLLYRGALHIEGADAKLAIKAAHATVGYVLVGSLIGRIIWGFLGNRYARWRAVLPNRQSLGAIREDLSALAGRRPLDHLGRGPLGRLSASVLFVLLLTSALTGLFRAGTDLYYPPLGGIVAAYVAKPGVDPATLVPGDKSLVDPERYRQVKDVRSVVGQVHLYSAYGLLAMIALHVTSVILQEIRRGGGLVSAMFSGKKVLRARPVDADEPGAVGD